MLQKLNNQGYTFTDNGRVIVVDKYGAVKRLTNLTLTTIGTTGPATLIGNVLNIPDYTEMYFGTVTSVGLSMPAAFTVTNSPVTTAGTLTVTGAGLVSQYIRGDGTLADFPGSTGGGSSVAYYLNGSVNQGIFGGNTYYQMSRTPVAGAGTNFTIGANGYIASFITDASDPSLISIPSGSWNIQFYMSANLSGGTPSFYIELYKYDGVSFTLISTGVTTPENITGGTSVDLYYTSIAVPTTALTVTDRLAVRVYVNNGGRTITLYTEGTNLAEIITTFTTGLTALNGLTAQVQYFTTGTSGTDFTISSATATHTFNLPVASALNTGKLSNTDWVTFNAKQDALSLTTTGSSGASTLIGSTLNVPAYTLSGLGGVPTSRTLTVNGTAYDLSADRSWSVGTVTSVAATAGTGISISGSPITGSGTLTITNTAPDQTVALTAGTGIGVSGTYPNFTITNTSPSSGGTVTSVAALTLGTTGTDLSSTVANPTTTPVITLNVPTASALNRGALSSADWTTFNGKVGGSGTTNYVSKFTASGTIGNSQIFDNGTNVGIGTASPSYLLDVNGTARISGAAVFNTATNTSSIQDLFSQPTFAALYLDQATPSLSNYAIASNGTNTLVNAASTSVILRIANSDRAVVYSNGNFSTGTSTSDIGFSLNLTSAGSSGLIRAGNFTYGAGGRFVHFNYGDETQTSSNYSIYYETGDLIFNTKTGGVFKYRINNIDVARIFTNGNFSIGYGLSPTDAGYKLDVNGTARVKEYLYLLRSDAATTIAALTYQAGNTIDIGNTFRVLGTNKWQNTVSSASYIENNYFTKVFASVPQTNGSWTMYDFQLFSSMAPTIASSYNQKVIGTAFTIQSTAVNSFFGVDVRATDNSSSIANNVYAIYADATLGTNTSATRWAGYFVGRGYFSGDVGIGTTSPTAKLHVVYAPAVIGATFTSARIVAGSGQVNQTATALSLESSGTNGGEAIYTGLNVSANSRTVITGVNSVVSKNWGGATLAGNAIGVFGSATTDSSSGVAYGGSFVGVSNAGTTYGLYANVTGSGTRIPFAVAVSGTEAMRVSSSSNLLVGTTTDAGQKLQVNGTSNFSNTLTGTVIQTTSRLETNEIRRRTTGNLIISTVNNTPSFIEFRDVATGNISTGNYVSYFTNNTIIGHSGNLNISIINPTINQTSGTGTIYGYRFNPTNTAVLSTVWAFYADSGKSYFGDQVAIGTTSPNASALLDITSTTKGFLPPRLTTTQKNAITTPATGLVVYDTTLNKLSVYTGAGWETVTSV